MAEAAADAEVSSNASADAERFMVKKNSIINGSLKVKTISPSPTQLRSHNSRTILHTIDSSRVIILWLYNKI